MKKSRYLFTISFVITSCILGGFFGFCTAYENTVKTARGEYRRAIDVNKDEIRIFDYVYRIKGG